MDDNNKKWREEWEQEWALEKQTEGLDKKAVTEQKKIVGELEEQFKSKKHTNGHCDCDSKCCKF